MQIFDTFQSITISLFVSSSARSGFHLTDRSDELFTSGRSGQDSPDGAAV